MPDQSKQALDKTRHGRTKQDRATQDMTRPLRYGKKLKESVVQRMRQAASNPFPRQAKTRDDMT